MTVIVLEKPWATHYRVKTYVRESLPLASNTPLGGRGVAKDASLRYPF
ncbi:MAG: hypothetical protein HQK89_14000 [Nitrospirae bacterium]|nr:hypothetical protein [Nitrospirota bacterium]